jgi:competence protein ComFC
MLAVILKWCEYIFPEREHHRVVSKLTNEDVIQYVRPTETNGIVALLPFREPVVKALIHEAKFHHNEKAWELLAYALDQYLRHTATLTVILPIPLSAERHKSRGYNQVEEVAKRALGNGRLILNTHFLLRWRDTKPQTRLERKERKKNVVDAFRVRPGNELTSQNVIILDDVSTTGATLKAAEASLRPRHPASITLLALAH